MNEIVADMLAQHFSQLNFVSLSAGCVHELRLPQKEGKTKKIPVALKVYRSEVENVVLCENDEDYYPLTPDSGESAIVFFEDSGCKLQKSTRRYEVWKGELKMICWLNMKLIGLDNGPGIIQEATRRHLPQELAPDGNFYGGHMKTSQILPKRPSPFEKYDLDEAQSQFITFPFDCFSFKLEYEVRAAKGCISNVVVNPIEC